MKKILFGIICSVLFFSCGSFVDEYIETNPFPKYSWQQAADSSSSSFINSHWNTTRNHFNNDNKGNIGQWDYWPEAHGLDVLVDAYLRTGDEKYKTCITNFYNGARTKNGNSWYNNYYDDMGWHGMAHLRALEAINDTRYETSARQLWGYIVPTGWDSEKGGIRWNHENTPEGLSTGVPSTGPATIIAARRWQKYGKTETFGGDNDSIWMARCYHWMKDNCRVSQSGRIYENIDDTRGDWTYNAGTFIGAALELYKVTGEKMYLNDAIKTADWAIGFLIDGNNRVLSDWAEQTDHDVNLFKGIFVRYFTRLIMNDDLPDVKRKRYTAFMVNSANYLWTTGTQKHSTILYSHRWWEPLTADVAYLRSQLSGCMMLEAMALLEKEGYLD